MRAKKKILMLVLTICSLSLLAQEQAKYEVSVSAGGGLSTLQYDLQYGHNKLGLGGNVGVGIAYFFNDNWGLNSGLELSLFNAKVKMNEFTDKYTATDFEGVNFEYTTTVKGYKEKQYGTMLQIPIMVQYQTMGNHKFYVSGGTKIGFPISSKYKVEKTTYALSGYYDEEGIDYSEEFRFVGFGSFANQQAKENLKLKVSFALSVETGFKWKLGDRTSLYTGIYADYGLNDINKNKAKNNLVQYNASSPRDFINNSVLTSQYNEEDKRKAVADKINLLSAGVKVKFAFGL